MYRGDAIQAVKHQSADKTGNSESHALSPLGEIPPEIQRERCAAAARKAKEFLLNTPRKIDTERLAYLLEAYREFDYKPPVVLRAAFRQAVEIQAYLSRRQSHRRHRHRPSRRRLCLSGMGFRMDSQGIEPVDDEPSGKNRHSQGRKAAHDRSGALFQGK